jgi:hypothetical protein
MNNPRPNRSATVIEGSQRQRSKACHISQNTVDEAANIPAYCLSKDNLGLRQLPSR